MALRKLSIESNHFLRSNKNNVNVAATAQPFHDQQQQQQQQQFERVAVPVEKPLDITGMSPNDAAFFNDNED